MEVLQRRAEPHVVFGANQRNLKDQDPVWLQEVKCCFDRTFQVGYVFENCNGQRHIEPAGIGFFR